MTQSAYQTWQQPYYPAPAATPMAPAATPMAPAAAPAQPPAAAPVRRVGVAGLTLAILGAVLGIASFTTLQWFRDGTVRLQSDRSGTFDRVHDVLSRITLGTGFQVEPKATAVHYFSWLAWVLLLAVVAMAVLASVPTTAAPVFRVLGSVAALIAIGATFKAIDLLEFHAGADAYGAAPSYGEYLSKAGVGFYTALAGFLLAGLGALIGSRERRS